MPADILQSCHQHLAKVYRERLGKTFSDSLQDLAEGRSPLWRFVNPKDLTTETDANTATTAGLLLDPEIGLLCYFLPFGEKAELRRQITRALKLRSRLSTDTSGSDADCDQFGAWRIAAVWLVENRYKESWIHQVTQVRRETAFSEEMSLDAIFLTGDVDHDLDGYGFPRLLLTTREVLNKDRRDEMTRWMSADARVIEALSDFTALFPKKEQRDLAAEVAAALLDLRAKPNREVRESAAEPTPLHSLRIQDFRNLRDVNLEFGLQPVSAHIIHGPNGTGKTSLCEAISIAFFGSSQRYKAFANREQEKDVVGANRAAVYIDRYLTPLDSPGSEPTISLNGGLAKRPSLVDAEHIAETDLAMGGTVLMQDSSQEFTRLSSQQLGARVLRGYSDLADEIEEFTESRYTQAGSARQDFLRSLGVSASITKLDTAYERLSSRVLDRSLPAMPHQLVSWIEGLATTRLASAASNLSSKWRLWGNEQSRSALSSELATNVSADALQHVLRQHLERYEELVTVTEEFLSDVAKKIISTRQELEQAATLITTWGEWLDRSSAVKPKISTEGDKLAKQSKELEAESQRILALGQRTKAHLDHLVQAEAFLHQNWLQHHENNCPTCGTDHTAEGGILRVVESLHSKVAAEREGLLQLFAESKSRLEETQKSLSQLGVTECPVNSDQQNKLADTLRWLVPEPHSVPECIPVRALRTDLLNSIRTIAQKPPPPGKVVADTVASQIADQLHSQFEHARHVFEAPSNWKPVKERLTNILASIVRDHLPNTLARLWCELTMALTAAPWLLPGRPCIGVITRRGEQKSTIDIEDRLARYILNQAEVHTLGLAWFFTRYLTHGRFSHSCIVLDDPAQELDQTSFRDLCRLWETWLRLHRVYDRPLRFVVMLNQESRALDAARATGGLLAVLGWSREQEESVQTVSLRGDRFCPPRPAQLFEAAS